MPLPRGCKRSVIWNRWIICAWLYVDGLNKGKRTTIISFWNLDFLTGWENVPQFEMQNFARIHQLALKSCSTVHNRTEDPLLTSPCISSLVRPSQSLFVETTVVEVELTPKPQLIETNCTSMTWQKNSGVLTWLWDIWHDKRMSRTKCCVHIVIGINDGGLLQVRVIFAPRIKQDTGDNTDRWSLYTTSE